MTLSPSFVHHFSSLDPWENLAREECWLDELPPGASALLFYVNRPCVVLGKHQNPFREVRVAEASRRSIPLLRRVSGGGTVYHDEGNLNWSYLGPKQGYDRTIVTQSIAAGLRSLGLELQPGEKGDLFLGERKVSGAAYLFRRDRVLHHGTLLCRAQLDALHGVLGPTGSLVEWVGVASRPMPVTNLGVEPQAALDALAAALAPQASVGDGQGDADFEGKVRDRAEERRRSTWLWDQTPPFTWEGDTRRGQLRAQVREGKIEAAWDDRNQIMSKMVGIRFFDPELFAYLSREDV